MQSIVDCVINPKKETDTMTTIIINKTGRSVDINESDIPTNAKEFIFNYGLRQMLNDCHSSLVAKDWDTEKDGDYATAVNKVVDAKIAQILAGDLTTRRGSSEPIDPVERMALRIAREAVKNALKSKKGLSIKAYEAANGEGSYDTLVEKHLEKNNEQIVKEAKIQLKKLAEHVVEVDLE
jgi:hypothetical protein